MRPVIRASLLSAAAATLLTMAALYDRGGFRPPPLDETTVQADAHPEPGAPLSAVAPPAPLSVEETNNIAVYERVSPSVVNITTVEVAYDFFFSPVEETGTGSGAVLDRQGHILTNHHVVQGADHIQVTLADQSQHAARVVGADAVNDLAVLRIDAPADQLSPIPLGTSAGLRVGQKVYAIGNPFGLSHTLTIGIISSLGRSIRSRAGYLIDGVIQTDAAINPGNSGGPLLDSAGRMVGVNTSIFTTSGGSIGIGFAVPVDTVRQVATDLIRHGRVRRPWIGIRGQDVGARLARRLDLPDRSGVLVAFVEPGSSAAQAGVRGGDRRVLAGNVRVVIGGDYILAVDDRPVTTMSELTGALINRRPGERVNLRLVRHGREMDLPMTLVEGNGGRRGFRL